VIFHAIKLLFYNKTLYKIKVLFWDKIWINIFNGQNLLDLKKIFKYTFMGAFTLNIKSLHSCLGTGDFTEIDDSK